MKLSLLVFCLAFVFITISYAETPNDPAKRRTARIAGTYSYGFTVEEHHDPTISPITGGSQELGPSGSLFIYPETDSTVLFYFDISSGFPSYNVGTLYGRLLIKNNKAIYNYKLPGETVFCKLSFDFTKKHIVVKTVEGMTACSFGPNIIADNRYFRYNGAIPEYVKSGNETIVFSTMSPENYNQSKKTTIP